MPADSAPTSRIKDQSSRWVIHRTHLWKNPHSFMLKTGRCLIFEKDSRLKTTRSGMNLKVWGWANYLQMNHYSRYSKVDIYYWYSIVENFAILTLEKFDGFVRGFSFRNPSSIFFSCHNDIFTLINTRTIELNSKFVPFNMKCFTSLIFIPGMLIAYLRS